MTFPVVFPVTLQTTQIKQTVIDNPNAGNYQVGRVIVTYPSGGSFNAKLKINDNGVETVLWSFVLSDGDVVNDTTGYGLTQGCSLVIEGSVGLNVSLFA